MNGIGQPALWKHVKGGRLSGAGSQPNRVEAGAKRCLRAQEILKVHFSG
jgi:hypothetical protein